VRLADEPGDDEDFSSRTCPAVPGYQLRIDVDDARDEVTLLPRGAAEQPLRLAETVAGGDFSEVRGPAWWWLKKGRPMAVIVSLHVAALGPDLERTVAHHLVAKMGDETCVVFDERTLERAKRRASKAPEAACLEPLRSRR
jgi:hypothetical protein